MLSSTLEQYKFYLNVMRLPAGVSADDIETRFKFLAHRYHPDHNEGAAEANDKFRELLDARNFLKNNYRAGQVWARTKNGLEWEWNRPSYREPRREQKATSSTPPPPPRPSMNRAPSRPSWEGIKPVGDAKPEEKAAPKAETKRPRPAAKPSALKQKAHAAYTRVASMKIDKSFTAAFLCVLLAIFGIYWKSPAKVKTVGDFGKKISTPVAPAKSKVISTPKPKAEDLARKTIAKNWGLVANCLGAMPTSRAYRGSVTYRVTIEKQLASKIVIVNDSLGFPLAHKCVSRAIFAMDFGGVREKTVVQFGGNFELGVPRVARR